MNTTKPNTNLTTAIFNSFENRHKLTTAEEVSDIQAHVKDALSQVFTKAMLKDRTEEIAQVLSTSFGLTAMNANFNELIAKALEEVFKEVSK